MYYIELKKFKFVSLIIILFFAFSLLSLHVKAEDELVLLPDDEQSLGNDFSEDDAFEKSSTIKRKSRIKKEPFLHDRAFVPANENSTFNALVMRVSLILFAVIMFLALIKLVLSRDQFGKPGGLLDELTQKFTGGLLNTQGLKLKQTLILTPGQNLYLIEIDGKRLLVGGTQHGGVQFVTDLTQEISNKGKLDFKQIEPNYQSAPETSKPTSTIIESPFMEEQNVLANKDLPDEIKQKVIVNGFHNKQTFKRRTNFRKSLFNENISNTKELLRKA